MPNTKECGEVVVELYNALSLHALKKLLGPGLALLSPVDRVKFLRIYSYGPQDQADPPFQTVVEELTGAPISQSAIATLEDLGLTGEQLLEMPVPEFRQLLEDHWVAELERVPPP